MPFTHGPETDELVRSFVSVRHALGLTQEDVDFRAGWADHYCGKLEAREKNPSVPLLAIWAQALGGRFILLPPLPLTEIEAWRSRKLNGRRRAVARRLDLAQAA